MSQTPLLKAWLDVVFKMLFERDPELLREMLEVVLEVTIRSVTILDPGVYGDLTSDKLVRFDIRAELAEGQRVDIEMQMLVRKEFRHRIVFYGARDYASQLGPGDEYGTLRPTIVIAWLGGRLFDYDPQHLHRVFELMERSSGELLSDHLKFHILQLQDFKGEPLGPENEKIQKLRRWARFFLVESRDELKSLAEEDPTMARAAEVLETLSLDPAAARRAQDREIAERFYREDLKEERKEAKAEGEAVGEARGKAEGERLVLQKFIARKFGAIDEATLKKLSDATPERLELWAERLFDAGSVDELFRE